MRFYDNKSSEELEVHVYCVNKIFAILNFSEVEVFTHDHSYMPGGA